MKIQIDDKDFDLMIEFDQVEKRIRLIGIQLNVDYEHRIPVFVGVLNGSFIFMADLMKEIHISSEITFVKISSYEGDKNTGEMREEIGLGIDLKDRDVIIVEDIIDSGATINYLVEQIKHHQPASVSVCTLLIKPKSLKHDIKEIRYTGFEIPEGFVVGYGMDYKGLGRNLKDIYRAVYIPAET